MEKSCEGCKKLFCTKIKKQRFCNKSCSAQHRVINGQSNRIYDHKCENCERLYYSQSLRQRFCSRFCLHKFLGKQCEKPKKNITCLMCKNVFTVTISKKRKFCSEQCCRDWFHKYPNQISKAHRTIISSTRKRDWANGETYKNVIAARTKWYDFIDKNGKKLRLQGTWELAFVKWLDDNDFTYTVHTGAIWYEMKGERRVYLPDFYIEEWKTFVDVKNDYLYRLTKEKIDCVIATGIALKILLKSDLEKLGILLS